MKQVAVIGAGFTGLAAAYLLGKKNYKVDLYDRYPIGESASGIAAGLLHPFGGPRAKLNVQGREGMIKTLELITEAEKGLDKQISRKTGLIRYATSPEQYIDFSSCVALYSDVKLLPDGISIENAYQVDCPLYLQGLWKLCSTFGVQFIQQAVNSTARIKKQYDLCIFTVGAYTVDIDGLAHLPIRKLKGQLLELERKKEILPDDIPITLDSYLIPRKKSYIVGATFEREFFDEHPHVEMAKAQLLDPLAAKFPDIKQLPILCCRAGLRATAPNHLPFCKEIEPGVWVATGLGSKGLLYHGLLAEKLCELISSN